MQATAAKQVKREEAQRRRAARLSGGNSLSGEQKRSRGRPRKYPLPHAESPPATTTRSTANKHKDYCDDCNFKGNDDNRK